MAANSSVEVANMALHILGAKPITSFTEGTKFATLVDSLFDTTRDAALRGYPWNFAMKRASLARLLDAPAFGPAYQFQLPTDCLRVLEVSPDVPYTVEGRMVLVDSAELAIRYTARITSPAAWDDQFKAAFAARLAMDMAYAATELTSMVGVAQRAYAAAIGDARSADAQEGSVQSATGGGADVLISARRAFVTPISERLPISGDFGSL